MASRDEVTLDRAMNALGTKLGVKEDGMGKEAMKKTAEAVTYSGTGAAVDAGDYGTQAEAVGAQNKETRESGAPAEPDRKGSQVQTVNPATDGSYSLGDSPKLAELDPKTAAQVINIMDRATRGLMKRADDTTNTPASGAGQMPGTGGASIAPADGPEIGGAPDQDAATPDAGLAAAPGQPAGTTDALIQQKIEEYDNKIQSDKTVVDALKDIASQAGVPTLAAKPAEAAIPSRHSSAISSGASSAESARSSEGSAPKKTSAIPPRHRSSGSSGGRTSMWSSARSSAGGRGPDDTDQTLPYERPKTPVGAPGGSGRKSSMVRQATPTGIVDRPGGEHLNPQPIPGKQITPQGFFIGDTDGQAHNINEGTPTPVPGDTAGKGRGIPGRFSSGASAGRSSARSAKTSGFRRQGADSGYIGEGAGVRGVPASQPERAGDELGRIGRDLYDAGGQVVQRGKDIIDDPWGSLVAPLAHPIDTAKEEWKAIQQGWEGGKGRGSSSSARSSAKTSMYREGADAAMTTPADLPYKERNAQVDIADMTLAQDPDRTLYTQSKGKSDGTPSPSMPQEFGPGSDRDYVLASRRYNQAVVKAASKMKAAGMTEAQAQQTLADTIIHQAALRVEAAKENVKTASTRYYQELNKLVAAGHTYEAATQAVQKRHGTDIKASSLRFKQALRGFVPMLIQAEQELAPQDVNIPGGTHPEYSGNDAGDRKPDDISDGNVDTLVSPETQAVETQADQQMDQRHNGAIAGSVTTARLSRKDAQPALAARETLLAMAEKLGGISAMWAKRATSGQTTAVLNSMTRRAVALKTTADQIEKLVRVGAKGGDLKRIHAGLVNAVKVAESQAKHAHEMIVLAFTFGTEVTVREAKLARVAPAMTLAYNMQATGHLDPLAVPAKTMEFVHMTGGEFKVAQRMVQGLQPVSRMGKSAVRLPRYTGGDPTNELDGIFE